MIFNVSLHSDANKPWSISGNPQRPNTCHVRGSVCVCKHKEAGEKGCGLCASKGGKDGAMFGREKKTGGWTKGLLQQLATIVVSL